MLSPYAQAEFGSQDAFNQYWSQFTEVCSENATGRRHERRRLGERAGATSPTPRRPGRSTQHKNIRVTRINGQLLIDSDAK